MSSLRAAADLLAAGYSPIPFLKGAKRPSVHTRPLLGRAMPASLLPAVFADDSNVAVACGSASGNLLVFDADSPSASDELWRRLCHLGFDVLPEIVSGSTGAHAGGVKAMLRLDTAPATSNSADVQDLEFLGRGVAALLPPSLHPEGREYMWSSMLDYRNVPMLEFADVQRVFPGLQPAPSWYISLRADTMLRGDPAYRLTTSGGASASDASIVCSLCSTGVPLDDIGRLLRQDGGYGHYAALPAADADAWLMRTYEGAAGFLEHNGVEIAERLDEITAAASLIDWAHLGGWGAVARRNSQAAFIALLTGDITDYRLSGNGLCRSQSLRQIAENIGSSYKGAWSAVQRLLDAGILETSKAGSMVTSREYRLSVDTLLSAHAESFSFKDLTEKDDSERAERDGAFSAHPRTGSFNRNILGELQRSDLVYSTGMGKAGIRVLTAMLSQAGEWGSVSELLATMGEEVVGRATFKRYLARLRETGAVECAGNGRYTRWRWVGSADVDEVITVLSDWFGVSGKRDSEARRHVHETMSQAIKAHGGRYGDSDGS